MDSWRRILIIGAIVGGSSALAECSSGQATPDVAPLPYGASAPGPITPLPSTTANSAPSDPGSLWTAPRNPNWSAPSNPAWPSAGQSMVVPSVGNLGAPGMSISSDPLQQPNAPGTVTFAQVMQSNWYTRIDYFHWNERIGSMDFVNESGALYTLGYMRRFGQQRFRTELFGGSMNYDGGIQFDDGTSEPLTTRTRYLGGLVEAEHLIEPTWWPQGAFFVGVGSRFWIRDIRSGFGSLGDFCDETQETWWTLYPYLGLQHAYALQNGLEWYGSARVGVTAATYNFSNAYNLPVYPRLGGMGNLELGLRGARLSVSGTFGIMSWSRSAREQFSTTDSNGTFVIASVYQPNSTLITVGGKVSYSF
jgi:hypothetical protein